MVFEYASVQRVKNMFEPGKTKYARVKLGERFNLRQKLEETTCGSLICFKFVYFSFTRALLNTQNKLNQDYSLGFNIKNGTANTQNNQKTSFQIL